MKTNIENYIEMDTIASIKSVVEGRTKSAKIQHMTIDKFRNIIINLYGDIEFRPIVIFDSDFDIKFRINNTYYILDGSFLYGNFKFSLLPNIIL